MQRKSKMLYAYNAVMVFRTPQSPEKMLTAI